jgi:hypothetical protein
MRIEKPDKKSLQYLGIIIIIAIIVCIGFFYYRSLMSEPEIEDGVLEELKQERIIKQQLKELEELGEDAEPLTDEEIQKQLEELNKLR